MTECMPPSLSPDDRIDFARIKLIEIVLDRHGKSIASLYVNFSFTHAVAASTLSSFACIVALVLAAIINAEMKIGLAMIACGTSLTMNNILLIFFQRRVTKILHVNSDEAAVPEAAQQNSKPAAH